MNLTTVYASDLSQPLTSPFPVRDGWFFALRAGDLFSVDSWKNPTMIRRGTVTTPRPFVSWRKGSLGFYIGWKAFGADTENMRAIRFINPADVYDGSVAIQGFTIRFSRTVE